MKAYPELKGSDLVRETCGKCFGTGVVTWGRVTFTVGDKPEDRYCFDCNGRGYRMLKVSSIRARERRQAKAAEAAAAQAAAYAARNAERIAAAAAAEARHEAARVAKIEGSKWLGIEGEKITLTLTIDRMVSFDGTYGPSYLWLMRDPDGQSVTCYSSAKAMFDWRDAGGPAEVTATVKAHATYQDVRQTQIVRPKVTR